MTKKRRHDVKSTSLSSLGNVVIFCVSSDGQTRFNTFCLNCLKIFVKMGNICSKKKAIRKHISEAGVKHEASKETPPVWRLLCCCAKSQTEETENGKILKMQLCILFTFHNEKNPSIHTCMRVSPLLVRSIQVFRRCAVRKGSV